MQPYISSKHKHVLDANQLSDFDRLWDCHSEWFETPNHDRAGWSGVNHLKLQSPGGEALGVFLKRQQNYVRRTIWHPFTGESTFACEFRTMRFLLERGVAVPRPLFFDEKQAKDGMQAVLMTEELADFKPLDCIIADFDIRTRDARRIKRAIMRSVATTVRKLHLARIQHRALYPKHIFVNMSSPDMPETAIIDLEKARIKFLPIMRTLQDLGTLNRDIPQLSDADRLYFFKQYYAVGRLTPWLKLVFRLIRRRSIKRAKKPASTEAASVR